MASYTTARPTHRDTARVVRSGYDADSLAERAPEPTLIDAMRRNAFVILFMTLFLATAAYLVADDQAPTYTASADVFLDTPEDNSNGSFDPVRYARNQSALINSPGTADAVAVALGLASPEDIPGSYSAEPSDEIDVVTVTVESDTPDSSVRLANEVTNAYQLLNRRETEALRDATAARRNALAQELADFDAQLEDAPDDSTVQAQRDNVAAQLTATTGQLADYESEIAGGAFGVRRFRSPTLPTSPSSPRPNQTALFGGVFGLLLACALVYLSAVRSPRAILPKHAVGRLGVPLLGVVKRGRGGPERQDAYRRVLGLSISRLDDGVPALGVTSASRRSSAAATLELAEAATAEGWAVTVADADSSAPVASSAQAPRRGAAAAVRLAPPVPVDRGQPMVEHWMSEITTDVGDGSPMVVANLPEMLADPTSMRLAPSLSGVLVVVTPETRLRDLDDLVQLAALLEVNLLGVVFHHSELR